MPAVDASALTKLSKRLLAASTNAPKELARVAREGRPLAKDELSKALGAKYNLTPARLRTIRSNASGAYGIEVSAPDRPIMVNRGYRANQNKTGLRYAIEKGGPVTLLREGFISKTKRLAFRRTTPARLPIAPVTGPSVAALLDSPATKPAVQKIITILGDQVTQRIENFINGS